GGGAGAAQAEMITKKLANYWCLIGSIPLVLFLLVALPTIFYVKKFSEYVNADYCDTKSCKELYETGKRSRWCTFMAGAARLDIDIGKLDNNRALTFHVPGPVYRSSTVSSFL
ncbi:hypothetical protein MTO96_041029, partial [Rhipicephalus appendiculatus]